MRKIAPDFFFEVPLWWTLFMFLDIGRTFDYWASGVASGFIEPGTMRTSPQSPFQWDHMTQYIQLFLVPHLRLSFISALAIALAYAICKYKIQQSSGAYAVRGIKLSVRLQRTKNILVASFIILILFQIYDTLLAFAFKFLLPYVAIPLFAAMLLLGGQLLNFLCPNIDRPQQG